MRKKNGKKKTLRMKNGKRKSGKGIKQIILFS
jgi:hypothetical protein